MLVGQKDRMLNYQLYGLTHFVSVGKMWGKSRMQKWLTDSSSVSHFLVPGAGVEPAQPCGHWCLRPARLPIPPSGQIFGKRIGVQMY